MRFNKDSKKILKDAFAITLRTYVVLTSYAMLYDHSLLHFL